MMEVHALAQALLKETGLLKSKTEKIGRRYDLHGRITKAEIVDITRGLTEQEEIANKLVNKTNGGQVRSEESKDIHKQLNDLKKKVSEYEKRIACLEKENREKDISIAKINDEFQEFKTKMELMFMENQNKQSKMQKELQETQNKQSKTQNELTEMKDTLKRGQLVYDFERALVKYIYPKSCAQFPTENRFSSMKKWLKENEDTPQGRVAKKKWDDLKREFSWSPEHEKVFFKMIRCRLKFAHPNDTVPVEPETFTNEEKEYVNVISKMNDRLNELIKG